MRYLINLREVHAARGPEWAQAVARIALTGGPEGPGSFDVSEPFDLPAAMLQQTEDSEVLLGFISLEQSSVPEVGQTERLACGLEQSMEEWIEQICEDDDNKVTINIVRLDGTESRFTLPAVNTTGEAVRAKAQAFARRMELGEVAQGAQHYERPRPKKKI